MAVGEIGVDMLMVVGVKLGLTVVVVVMVEVVAVVKLAGW